MTKVKICGNTNAEDVKRAIDLGADYLGFIFTESKRKIDEAAAQDIMRAFPEYPSFVGVFSNQPKEFVETLARRLGLRFLQFHGDETALYCQHFMDEGFEVIKTFRVKDAMSLKRIDEYNVSAFLFDTFSNTEKGGTGKTFDWNLIGDRAYLLDKLFLAGGLNVDNLREAIQKVKPFAVDVASGVESAPGKKDPQLLERFIKIAKEGQKKDVRKSPLPT
ncbi:MAG TPA: phosphoribosylanthranilate isomerase [Verrucomicrobiae bacterium]|jgi:phosphoribosylanthranilate isomerase|nr:phosphoribosylanthranilate isomerase [Verrucomicrobiae bacterium]